MRYDWNVSINIVMGDVWMPEHEREYIPWCDTVWYAEKFWINFNTTSSIKILKDLDSRLGGVTGRSSVNQGGCGCECDGGFQTPKKMINIICWSDYNVYNTIVTTLQI